MSNDKAPKTDQLTTAAQSALARPSYIADGDARGTEHLTKDDLQMPRLAVAQKTSHELEPDHPRYIDGLKFLDLFNSLTGEIHGRGPLEFVVVRADPPRYIEFNPLEQGGGVKDFNVPPNDPRTQFTTDADGKSVPPVATKFYDFIVLMLPSLEPIALSFKSSGLKAAKQLNTYMKLRGGPIFAGKYVLTSAMASNAKGAYAVYQIKPAGFVDEQTYHAAEAAFGSFRDRAITVDRGEAHEDEAQPGDTSFDTKEM